MQAFADLLERLMLTPSRKGKRNILVAFFRDVPSPDRGFALAVLVGAMEAPRVKPAAIRALIEARMDAELFRLSYANGGDLAETVALVWPGEMRANRAVPVAEFVAELEAVEVGARAALISGWLDGLDATGRWAVLKLVMGGVKTGVTPRLAREALAAFGGVDVAAVEEIWHGLAPPYDGLFAWLDGASERPQPGHAAPFLMLAETQVIADVDGMELEAFAAESGMSGMRVLLAREGIVRRLYSSDGDEISHLFPDVLDDVHFQGAVEGTLFVRAGGSDGLAKRLKRKKTSKAQMLELPAFVCVHDVLNLEEGDLRALPFTARREALEGMTWDCAGSRIEISEWVNDAHVARNGVGAGGVRLTRLDAAYGAPGARLMWPRELHRIQATLMYAERGTGRQSNAYALGTFGVWANLDGADVLLPIGKAAFDLDNEAMAQIDLFVRANTVEKFGPVRGLTATRDEGLVFEIAFEGVEPAKRRKSGLNVGGLRVERLCEGLLPNEAARIATLEALLPDA